MRKTNMQTINQAKRRPTTYVSPSQVACRICDQVFSSTQALISHIESHIKLHGTLLTSSLSNHHSPTLNLSSSAHKSRSTTGAPAPPATRNYLNPIQSDFSFPTRNHNIGKNEHFQNGCLSLTPQPTVAAAVASRQPTQIPMMLRQNLPFVPGQTQYFCGQAGREAGDCTMPLLHQLEKPRPEICASYLEDGRNKFNSGYVDLTLKL